MDLSKQCYCFKDKRKKNELFINECVLLIVFCTGQNKFFGNKNKCQTEVDKLQPLTAIDKEKSWAANIGSINNINIE